MVREGQVVAHQNGRPVARDVLHSVGTRLPQHREHRSESCLEHPVEHGSPLPMRECPSGTAIVVLPLPLTIEVIFPSGGGHRQSHHGATDEEDYRVPRRSASFVIPVFPPLAVSPPGRVCNAVVRGSCAVPEDQHHPVLWISPEPAAGVPHTTASTQSSRPTL